MLAQSLMPEVAPGDDLAHRVGAITPGEVWRLNPPLPAGSLPDRPSGRGIFDWPAD